MLKWSAVIALSCCFALFAAEPIATITAPAGSGLLVNGRPLQTAGAPTWPVSKGAQITTGSSSAVLSFADGARVTLAANTQVIVKKCDRCVVVLYRGSATYNAPANSNLEICALGHPVRAAAGGQGSVDVQDSGKVLVKIGDQAQAPAAGKCACKSDKKPLLYIAGAGAVAASTVAIVTASQQ